MHQNYFFLKRLVPVIEQKLTGFTLIEAFSQEKDEVIFSFLKGESSFHIKATLRNDFSCLHFPTNFDRARRNSVDLFTDLYNDTVIGTHVFSNERAFAILFSSHKQLIFKLFGNRSNVLLFNPEKQKITLLFKNKLGADFALTPETLNRKIPQDYDAFSAANGKPEKLYPTLGKQLLPYVNQQLATVNSIEEKFDLLQKVLASFNETNFFVGESSNGTTLSLFPLETNNQEFTSPLDALNHFYINYFRVGNLDKEKSRITSYLQKRINQTENYIDKSFQKLCEIEEGGKNEQYANIIMANLHQIPARAEKIKLHNFYTGIDEIIKLKKDYSPQKNAEIFYRKAKNEKLEREQLQSNISAREDSLSELKAFLVEAETKETIKALRLFIKENGLNPDNGIQEDPRELFKVVEFMGYVIWIGRNAKNNDLLTKKYATKHDLWLHARDVSGSHVVIKHIPGRNYPNPVIERAAELAAWYSKRKTDSLCPVIVTPKKFIRKTKGMADGQVIVEKEKVVMVVPKG